MPLQLYCLSRCVPCNTFPLYTHSLHTNQLVSECMFTVVTSVASRASRFQTLIIFLVIELIRRYFANVGESMHANGICLQACLNRQTITSPSSPTHFTSNINLKKMNQHECKRKKNYFNSRG